MRDSTLRCVYLGENKNSCKVKLKIAEREGIMNNSEDVVFGRAEIECRWRDSLWMGDWNYPKSLEKGDGFDDILSVAVRVISGLFHVLYNEKKITETEATAQI